MQAQLNRVPGRQISSVIAEYEVEPNRGGEEQHFEGKLSSGQDIIIGEQYQHPASQTNALKQGVVPLSSISSYHDKSQTSCHHCKTNENPHYVGKNLSVHPNL